ncbi:MAG TPA: hypothetical protein VKB79_28480 [Bryobacteraceae bacterium]|nr:hypothetical protein [Bryobacteraceae bacterium]
MAGPTEPLGEAISRAADDTVLSVISLAVTVVATVVVVAAIYVAVLFVERGFGLFGAASP